MSLADWANTVYGYFFVAAATGLGIWRLFQHGVHKSVETHMAELRAEIEPLLASNKRIEYALYNDGKTGLINKVEELLANQQCIRIDVEVLKAKAEQ